MSTQHTPGPWHIIGDRWNNEIVDAAGRDIGEAFDHDVGVDEAAANALLFAAAPELLAALIEPVQQMERMLADYGAPPDPDLSRWLTQARAAIARTKGGDHG